MESASTCPASSPLHTIAALLFSIHPLDCAVIYSTAVVSHPLLHNLALLLLQPLVPGPGLPPLWKPRTQTAPWGGTNSVSVTPPPPPQARPVAPSPSTSLCPCQAARAQHDGESDFWMVRRLLSFVPLNWTGNWATEEESRCLLRGVTQRGTDNGLNLSFSGSVDLIMNHNG